MTWDQAAVAFLILCVCCYMIVKRDPTHVQTSEEVVEEELSRRGGD